jgi:Amidohydrolase family/F5/8 type C domain
MIKLFLGLLGAALAVGVNAQQIDRVYYNGNLITVDPSLPVAQAIAIDSDGDIASVGSNSEILMLADENTSIIDLEGKTMLPGFNDSHSHWFSWRQHICEFSGDTTYPSLDEIMETLSMNGWTSISELNMGRPDNSSAEHLANALDLESRGKLSVRLNGYWGALNEGGLIETLNDHSMEPGHYYSDRIHTPGVKIYVDDPFGTANILTQEEVTTLVTSAFENGWQVAAHVVNQSAAEMILNAYESVLGSESNENYRLRIEHAVKISDAQLQRMKNKGIIASFQLIGPPDWPDQETFQTYISNTHPEWCLRWNDFMEAEAGGLRTTGSTDAPFNEITCDPSPFRAIYQAVTRQGYISREHADWELNQRITVEQAIKLLTINGAYATFEEDIKGSLTPGKVADLVILSQNPYEIADPEELLDIQVLMTMVGGKVEFCQSENMQLCGGQNGYLINDALITASSFLEGHTPDLVFDEDAETWWSSGSDAPQWIQIDLQQDYFISEIDMVTDQYPDGYTVHLLKAKAENAPDLSLLETFSGNTQTNQTLTYLAPVPLHAYRYVRVETTQSPSWVAWREITIQKSATGITEQAGSDQHAIGNVMLTPNPVNDHSLLSYSLDKPTKVMIRLVSPDGREHILFMDQSQPAGTHIIPLMTYLPAGLSGGFYLLVIETTESMAVQKLIIPEGITITGL